MVKVFEFNKNHKVEFTKKELEELLNEVYNRGYSEGKYSNYSWTWTSPYHYPYYCTADDNITISTTSGNNDCVTVTANSFSSTTGKVNIG